MPRPERRGASRSSWPRAAALERDRLARHIGSPWERGVVLVTAPAGSGKTTLLAQVARTAEIAHDGARKIAWLTLDSSDRAASRLIEHLKAAMIGAQDPASMDDFLAARSDRDGLADEVLLLLDDIQAILDTDSEAVLERLVACASPRLAVVMASRSTPSFNLPRWRVAGRLFEIGSDDLRFRSWEVERLFRDVYQQPLPPEDLAHLARRTEGWAAGLCMFHLATRGRSANEQRQAIGLLGSGSRLMHGYFSLNVLRDLAAEVRAFLVTTSVLGLLSGAMCDELTGHGGSDTMLEDLQRQHLFIEMVDDRGTYRYHDVWRDYLQELLWREHGEHEASRLYRLAGDILERAGVLPEALQARYRAGDRAAVARLLGLNGARLVREDPKWVEAVPPLARETDPWILLAAARHHRSAGNVVAALSDYAKGEAAFGPAGGAELCRRERQALNAWLDAKAFRPADWSGALREVTSREPLAAATRTAGLTEHHALFVRGLAALIAGYPGEARTSLQACMESHGASPQLAAAARLAAAVSLALSGDHDGADEIDSATDEAERLGLGWLSRMGRAALAFTTRPEGRSEAAAARIACERLGDPFGAALAGLMQGWAALVAGESVGSYLEESIATFRRTGAGALESWSRSVLALAGARAGTPEAQLLARQAEAGARNAGVRGALAIAYAALAEVSSLHEDDYQALVRSLHEESTLAVPARPSRTTTVPPSIPGESFRDIEARVRIRCLGGFDVWAEGRPIELSPLRPRARLVLRFLAMHGTHGVHREVLIDALWADSTVEVATRKLHVALSSLRRVFDSELGPVGRSIIVREGDAYRLTPEPIIDVDLVRFESELMSGARSLRAGDLVTAATAYEAALDIYRGDLLPEDGPSEWLVGERDRRRAQAADAALSCADLLLDMMQPMKAARICEAGLRIDRFRDDLWRLRVESLDRASASAAKAQAEREYAAMLDELGV